MEHMHDWALTTDALDNVCARCYECDAVLTREEIERILVASQQSFAPDVAYWMCERCGDFWHKDYHVCQTCDSPRR